MIGESDFDLSKFVRTSSATEKLKVRNMDDRAHIEI